MSELQLALIAIGALIIVAVLVINWWQERRFYRQVENNFSPLAHDPLLDDNSADYQKHAENKFEINDAYIRNKTINDDILDNEAGAYSLDEETVINESPFSHTDANYANKFMPLQPEDNEDNIDKLFQKDSISEESIEYAYNQIVNTGLGKSKMPPDAMESISLVKEDSSQLQVSDLKNIFESDLNQQDLPANAQSDSSESVSLQEELASNLAMGLPEMLYPQIDLTALIYLSSEASIDKLNKALIGLFENLDKPIFIHVLDAKKQWYLLKEVQANPTILNGLLSKVSCSIQLADRAGPIDKNVLNRFQLSVETLALDMNSQVEWQNMADVMSVANSLDLFCIDVDKTIRIHLVHGESGAFTGTKLRGLAEAQGLMLGLDGVFKYYGEPELPNNSASSKPSLHPSFVMFNRDNNPFNPDMLRSSVVKAITFQLDIPHVTQSVETFNQMLKIARKIELSLNAVLVDDNNKTLGDSQIDHIRQHLKLLHTKMLMRGIASGSAQAHRLFS